MNFFWGVGRRCWAYMVVHRSIAVRIMSVFFMILGIGYF